jgi:hypothetical protein
MIRKFNTQFPVFFLLIISATTAAWWYCRFAEPQLYGYPNSTSPSYSIRRWDSHQFDEIRQSWPLRSEKGEVFGVRLEFDLFGRTNSRRKQPAADPPDGHGFTRRGTNCGCGKNLER